MDDSRSTARGGLDLISKAISFAQRAHLGQLRKDGLTPYAAHPMRVLAVLMRVFGVEDPEVLAAAALHDTIEDTTTDRDDLIEAFGERVAGYVAALSKDSRLPEPEREQRYLDCLADAPVEVQLVKLGDVLDNLRDATSLSRRGRAKAVRKARELIERLAPTVPEDWAHALSSVRETMHALERAEAPSED